VQVSKPTSKLQERIMPGVRADFWLLKKSTSWYFCGRTIRNMPRACTAGLATKKQKLLTCEISDDI
jgi:hypothetical protein